MKINSFIKDLSIYGVGGVLTKFVGLLTAPVYTRFLDTEGYGQLDLATSFAAILMILLSMEMHTGYGRSYFESRSRGDLESLRGSVQCYYTLASLTVLALFYLFYEPLRTWLSVLDISLVEPVVWGLFPLLMIGLTLVTIRYEEKALEFTAITLAHVGLTTGCGIIAVSYYGLGVAGILWSNTLAGWVIFLFLITFKRQYTSFAISSKYLNEVFCYSAPITPAVLGNWVLEYIGRFFIAGVLSLSLLGIYSIALKVSLIVSLATNAFRFTWTPKAVGYFTQPASEPKFVVALEYYLLASTLVVVGVVSFSPLIVRLLAPESFSGAIAYVGFLTVSQMWNGSFNILAAGNNWARKTYYNSFGTIVAGLLTTLVLYYGIENGGLLVASIALLLGSIVKPLLTLVFAQKNHYIPYALKPLMFCLVMSVLYGFAGYIFYEHVGVSAWIYSMLLFVLGVALIVLIDAVVVKSWGRKLLTGEIVKYCSKVQ